MELCGKMFSWVDYELRLILLIVIRPNIQRPSTAHQALRERPHHGQSYVLQHKIKYFMQIFFVKKRKKEKNFGHLIGVLNWLDISPETQDVCTRLISHTNFNFIDIQTLVE